MANIVIGDGHVVLADALSTRMREGDCRVEVASTAADLVAVVDATSPDLCLLERWLNDDDALELLVGLRGRSPRTKIVVLTADPDRDGSSRPSTGAPSARRDCWSSRGGPGVETADSRLPSLLVVARALRGQAAGA